MKLSQGVQDILLVDAMKQKSSPEEPHVFQTTSELTEEIRRRDRINFVPPHETTNDILWLLGE